MYNLDFMMGLKSFIITDFKTPSFSNPISCGHCGVKNAPFLVLHEKNVEYRPVRVLVCSSCGMPIASNGQYLFPGCKIGRELDGLPVEISQAYDQARNTFSVNAFLGTVLICRKILMHIAVEKGAKEEESFLFYIDFLVKNSIITESMKEWVDEIRTNGNVATHQIEDITMEIAEDTINFTIQLLSIVYEMKYLADKRKKK